MAARADGVAVLRPALGDVFLDVFGSVAGDFIFNSLCSCFVICAHHLVVKVKREQVVQLVAELVINDGADRIAAGRVKFLLDVAFQLVLEQIDVVAPLRVHCHTADTLLAPAMRPCRPGNLPFFDVALGELAVIRIRPDTWISSPSTGDHSLDFLLAPAGELRLSCADECLILAQLEAPDGVPTYFDSPSSLYALSAVLSVSTTRQHRNQVVGMHFADGIPAVVVIDYDVSSLLIGDGGALVMTADGHWAINATRSLTTTSSATLRMAGQSVTVSGTGYQGEQIVEDVGTLVSESGVWAGMSWPSHVGIGYVEQCSAFLAQELRLVTRRFSNACYGLFDVSIAGAIESSHLIALVTPWGADGSIISTGQNAPWGRWATVHPVTHVITTDNRALCYV